MSSSRAVPTPAPASRFAAAPGRLRDLVTTARPQQWQKNLLVFVAFVFSSGSAWTVRDPAGWVPLLLSAGAAFCCFSAAASGEYFLNDAIDARADRLHPRKRDRPVAAGRITRRAAAGVGVALVVLGTGGAFAVGVALGWVVLGYAALTAAYSLALKRVVVVDVLAVAAGFALRAIGGAAAIGVAVSPWLYVCTTLGSLFVAVTKRRQEVALLDAGAGGHRGVLAAYTPALLGRMADAAMWALLLCYAAYSVTADNLPSNHAMALTLPIVITGTFRYRRLATRFPERNVDELLRDRPLLLAILAFTALAAGVMIAG